MPLSPGIVVATLRRVAMDGNSAWLENMRVVVADAVVAMGGRLVSLGVREAHARVDVESTVGFDAVVAWGTSAPCAELFVVTVEEATGATEVWRYPDDPALPGLATAVNPGAVGAYLATPIVLLEVVSLRPGRRAVVHARGDGIDAHVKVVPPAATRVIAERYEAFAAAGVPVPEVMATDERRGWVVLRTVAGRTLDECLESPDAPCPTATDLWALVESIAPVALEPTVMVTPASLHAARHARVISRAVPALEERVGRVVRALGGRPSGEWRGTVHGDLHPGQLVVGASGEIVGVLDVDGAGAGDVLDDIGQLVAHLMVAAALGRADVQRRGRFAAGLLDAGRARADERQMSLRVAASVLAHASGPWRAQADAWPTETERLVAVAEQVLDHGATAVLRSRRSP